MGVNVPKISIMELCILFILTNGLVSHVIINPLILGASGRDAWLVPIGSFVGLIGWSSILYFIIKRSGQEKLQPWLAKKTGKILSWLLILPIYAQVFIVGASTTLHTSSWTAVNYLPATPQFAVVLILLAICCYCAIAGLRAIAIGAGALLPFVVMLGYFVAIANSPHKEFRFLTPILEHGWGAFWEGMVFAGGCYVELVLLIVLQHHLKARVKLWHLIVLAAILTHIMAGPIIGAITEFGPHEAAKQVESPFEQWRLVKIGDYIEHVDFFSVFQWMAGASVRIALTLYLLADLLPIRRKRTRTKIIVVMSFVFLAISMLPISRETFHVLIKYYYQSSLYVIGIVALIWLGISFIGKSAKERSL